MFPSRDFEIDELAEAERYCAEAAALIAPTESRVSKLWLGPLYVDVLWALGKKDEARKNVVEYRELVAQCQSPRFARQAERLEQLILSR